MYPATKYYVKNILDNEKDFLRKSLNKVKKHAEMDSEFYYLGQKYDIILLPFQIMKIEDGKIYVQDLKVLDKWLKNETINIFSERLTYNYNLFNEKIPFPKLKIRKMKTRWGVCNKRDNSITLNSNLIKYSLKEIDYVIVHELSHFVHFDHSKEFWKQVSKYYPNYKETRKILRN